MILHQWEQREQPLITVKMRYKKKFFKRSRTNGKFENLYELIISEENIMLAYRTVKSNGGSNTPSTDKLTIKDLAKMEKEQFISYIRDALNFYKPKAIRRVLIPKADGVSKRPLGIPSIRDRVILQMFLNILEPICEAKFHKHSYGFRPNRAAHHAVARAQYLINRGNQYYTVDIDIKGFFDNVNHSLLLKQLWQIGIKDKRVIAIISKMLKAPISGLGIPTKGVPQGGILSPLLSNIVLNELDWWISNQWETFQTRHNYTRRHKYDALKNSSNLKPGFLIRYADDFRIMTDSYAHAERWFHAVKDFLKHRLKLDISETKSKIICVRDKSTSFLGFKIKAVQKGNKWVSHTFIEDKKIEQIVSNLKEKIYQLQKHPTATNVFKYNATVLGVQNYFKYATHISVSLKAIHHRIRITLKTRLQRCAKYDFPKGSIGLEYYTKFYPTTYRTYRIGNAFLFPIAIGRTQNNLCYSQNMNHYEEGKNYSWDNEIVKLMKSKIPNTSIEYLDNRLSKFSMQKGLCGITRLPLLAELAHCHHKIPLSLGGTDKFENLTIVHREIHKLIHATNLELICNIVEKFKMDSKQINKINQLRKLCNFELIAM